MTTALNSISDKFLQYAIDKQLIAQRAAQTYKDPANPPDQTLLAWIRKSRANSEEIIAEGFARIDIPRANLNHIDHNATDILGGQFGELTERHRFLPYALQDNRVYIAVDDPTDQNNLEQIYRLFPSGVILTYAPMHAQLAAMQISNDLSRLAWAFDLNRPAFPDISDDDYEQARISALHTDSVPSALTRLGLISEAEAHRTYAQYNNQIYRGYLPDTLDGTCIEEGYARMHRLLCINAADTRGRLVLLTDRCYSNEEIAGIFGRTEETVSIEFTTPSTMDTALDEAYATNRVLPKPTTFTEALVQMKYLDAAQLKDENAPDKALRAGKLTEEQYYQGLALYKGLPFINVDVDPPDDQVKDEIQQHILKEHKAYPHSVRNRELVVLITDPRRSQMLSAIRRNVRTPLTFAVTTPMAITRLLHRNLTAVQNSQELTNDITSRVPASVQITTNLIDDDNATMRVINDIVSQAVADKASDIHMEQRPEGLLVRYRIDGLLHLHQTYPPQSASAIITGIKNLARLRIEEKYAPQSGRIVYTRDNLDLNLRVETGRIASGTDGGEEVVMRILHKTTNLGTLESLNFQLRNLENFRRSLGRAHGIILITGPTGSGKTTTIFTALKELAKPEKKILTVEDPVEITLPNISQHEVNEPRGVTVEGLLRSFLRKDPDIILVGEIRDARIAKVALEAALTGHLVIASLHTNTATGAITRLREMGMEDYNIASALLGVMAQRLLPRLCTACRVEHVTTDEDFDLFAQVDAAPQMVYTAAENGCPLCKRRGYTGRIPVHEYLPVTPEIRAAISRHATEQELEALATTPEVGFTSMYLDGLRKVVEGHTTREAVKATTETI